MILFDNVTKKYAMFSGRATRKEYWSYILQYIIIAIVLWVIAFVGLALKSPAVAMIAEAIMFLVTIGLIVPSLAVFVRRLHDTGRSGWWFLVNFIPGVGGIISLIFLLLDSQPSDNVYGPNPKVVKVA